MKSLSGFVYKAYQNNKRQLWECLVFCVCIGLLAHGYTFFRNTFSHDSLQEFNGDIFGTQWKISLGRWFVPIYQLLSRGNITLPLLVGLSSLLWIGLASFMTVKFFEIKNRFLVFIIAGIYATNTTTTLTVATYLHDFDSDMFALFLSTLAAFLWQKNPKKLWRLVPCVVIILAIYQAYISVTITLIMMSLIIELLENSSAKTVFTRGINGLLSIVIGGVIYIAVFKLVLVITGIDEATGYNSLSVINLKNIAINLIKTGIYTPLKILAEPSSFPYSFAVFYNLFYIIAGLHCVICLIRKNNIQVKEILLLCMLFICLPLAMNMCEVLTNGMSHSIMYFAFCLIHPFVLVLQFRFIKYDDKFHKIFKWEQFLLIILSVIVLIGNIRFSNRVYLRKELEQAANLSLFTRVVDEMELEEEYDRETMPVCFIGEPENFSEHLSGFDRSYHKTGLWSGYLMNYHIQQRYDIYFEYVLHYPISTVTEQQAEVFSKSSEVNKMPVFPKDGCISVIDNTLVVKLGACDL